MWLLVVLMLFLMTDISKQQGSSAHAQPFPATITQTCPSAEERAAITDDLQEQVLSLLNITVQDQPPCACGGPALWTRIAHLNMSDPSQQCPSNWNLTTTPVRGCGRSTGNYTCDSAIFSSTGLSYSRVCGRVIAYQYGSPDAFYPTLREVIANNSADEPGLEGAYVEGVSLTHGAAGSRQHIWTFAATLWESDPRYGNLLAVSCSCVNTNFTWPFEVPAFVGNSSYFCDTGNPGPGFQYTLLYQDNTLWDDVGCGPTNACCEFNNPPWFCTTLPQATTNDLELRICLDKDDPDEDVVIHLIDIYVS